MATMETMTPGAVPGALVAAMRYARRPGVATFAPEGGTYVFVDLAPALGGRTMVALLERAIDEGVLVAPGAAFGAGFEAFVRVCFTSVPEADVLEGVDRLLRAIG